MVTRAGGSLGLVDLTALKATQCPRFIEVKSDDKKYGPFNNFGPERRAALLEIAGKAGAVPELAYWPPFGELEYIPPERWP